jgi:ferredoxin--NADP+ reductase
VVQATSEAKQVGEASGNATLIDIQRQTAGLAILRVRPDGGALAFEPGQYTTLGMRQPDGKPLRRSYSLSAPLVDAQGRLLPLEKLDFWEFYIRILDAEASGRPRLTPWLSRLAAGSRLLAGPKVAGRYTLTGVQPTDRVVFLSTGTGEAPHNAMVTQLLASGHVGEIRVVNCVRFRQETLYEQAHRDLERRFPQYRYWTATTRESEKSLSRPEVRAYKLRYLQELLASGDLERGFGFSLEPDRTHVFLCGNPAMIGSAPSEPMARPAPDPSEEPSSRHIRTNPPNRSTGMTELLVRRGFRVQSPREPGNLHLEAYW